MAIRKRTLSANGINKLANQIDTVPFINVHIRDKLNNHEVTMKLNYATASRLRLGASRFQTKNTPGIITRFAGDKPRILPPIAMMQKQIAELPNEKSPRGKGGSGSVSQYRQYQSVTVTPAPGRVSAPTGPARRLPRHHWALASRHEETASLPSRPWGHWPCSCVCTG